MDAISSILFGRKQNAWIQFQLNQKIISQVYGACECEAV